MPGPTVPSFLTPDSSHAASSELVRKKPDSVVEAALHLLTEASTILQYNEYLKTVKNNCRPEFHKQLIISFEDYLFNSLLVNSIIIPSIHYT